MTKEKDHTMKKISNFVLALGILGTLGAAAASASTTETISFTGYCDGMNLTLADGLVGGTLAGCETGFALGNTSVDFGLNPLDGTAGVLSNVQSTALGSTEIVTYYLDFTNDTWAVYGATGSLPFLINSGSFTVTPGNVPVNASGPSSKVKQDTKVIPNLPYSHTATISFTGFCDGMALTFSGDLIGGTLAGCSTGIAAGNTGTDFAVEPFGAAGSGVAANVGSNADGDGYLLNYYLDFASKTWANYDTTTGRPAFLRSGTFTIVSGSNPVVGNGPPSSKR
jgi:hypothetical protein